MVTNKTYIIKKDSVTDKEYFIFHVPCQIASKDLLCGLMTSLVSKWYLLSTSNLMFVFNKIIFWEPVMMNELFYQFHIK